MAKAAGVNCTALVSCAVALFAIGLAPCLVVTAAQVQTLAASQNSAPPSSVQTPPQAARPHLVIRDNVIRNNGYGIYIGPSKAWANAVIAGNTINGNGDGVYIVNRGIQILANQIEGNIVGVKLNDTIADPTGLADLASSVGPIYLSGNDISGNQEYGLLNLTLVQAEARQNWWGSPLGPAIGSQQAQSIAATRRVTYVWEPLDAQPQRAKGPLMRLIAQLTGGADRTSSLLTLAESDSASEESSVPEVVPELYSMMVTIATLVPPVYLSVVNSVEVISQPVAQPAGDTVQGKADTSDWAPAPPRAGQLSEGSKP